MAAGSRFVAVLRLVLTFLQLARASPILDLAAVQLLGAALDDLFLIVGFGWLHPRHWEFQIRSLLGSCRASASSSIAAPQVVASTALSALSLH